MSYTLLITLEARQDEADGYSYYEHLLPGLGDAFLEELDKRYKSITENPLLYSYIDNRQILRDIKIERFPYVIIFGVHDNNVVVFSVHNTYKQPGL